MNHRPITLRRRTLVAGALMAAATPFARAAGTDKLRIGYQKSSTLAIWLKSKGVLDQALAPLNVAPDWHEFSSGLPLLEALNVGALDITADVADAVPPFALAAGAQITYFATESPSPTAQAIVVKNDSPIRTLAQLRGRKVAFAKGAGAHYLLVAALRTAGLTLNDIEPAYLSPADGRAAFENGSVAAWVIWDPFLSAVQRQGGARVLRDGQGLSEYRRFYMASTAYAKRRDNVLAAVFAGLRDAGTWIKSNPAEAAQWYAPVIGLDAATVEAANARRSYAVQTVDAASLTEQQSIADTFSAAGVIPRQVIVSAAPVWRRA
jgi:sulfonate transport system substrate-binding protein